MLQCYTFFGALAPPCKPLHGGELNVAITTVYYRHKTVRGWRYSALGIGRRPEAAKTGPFFIRVRDSANKYKWQRHDTETAAQKAAELAPVARKAQELGLLPDDVTDEDEQESRSHQGCDRKLSERASLRATAIDQSV
jgi:hypothetical protein